MNGLILQCCSNKPAFLITYEIGSKFYVCNSCAQIVCWFRGIKEKISLNELEEGLVQDPPSSTPLEEVVNSG